MGRFDRLRRPFRTRPDTITDGDSVHTKETCGTSDKLGTASRSAEKRGGILGCCACSRNCHRRLGRYRVRGRYGGRGSTHRASEHRKTIWSRSHKWKETCGTSDKLGTASRSAEKRGGILGCCACSREAEAQLTEQASTGKQSGLDRIINFGTEGGLLTTPSKPPGANGKKPAAPLTNSARPAGRRRSEVEFLAVALDVSTDYADLFELAPTQSRTVTRFTREGLEGRVTVSGRVRKGLRNLSKRPIVCQSC
jgi:hypothetical protein